MFRIAEAFPDAAVLGVTVSGRQVETARREAAVRGLHRRCRFIHGDLRSADAGTGHDAAWAIESYAHLSDADGFFAAAARALRPGALLVLVDDFITRDPAGLEGRARACVDDFRAGWRVPGANTAAAAVARAARAGFEMIANENLTPLVRLGRPRDRVIRTLAPLFRASRLTPVPFFGNMVGGDALQRGLRDGVIAYRLLLFRRD
jgi:cyclopropane fatty-acyl-phospholipid synthase-like methyltransferase